MMYKTFAPVAECDIMPSESSPFSQWFRRQLAERRLSQAAFSRRSGASSGRVNDWFWGRAIPDPESAGKIAKGLDCDPEVVLRAMGYLDDDPYAADPNAPGEKIAALARRVRWTNERFTTVYGILSGYAEGDSGDS